ncbi:DUF808 domain-containing protein [Onishia niordana]|uniref:DUF808 domain-containing protein n=1 Tax=Onishia niordana TaxID=2508711 RepID=UPI0010A03EFA|nr:DUF808 domain-containing protein [Halomonas niordiana]
MAGASLLTLIDDIATLLDDVSLMTKVAAKKTAGVLGDDLALNAQQVTGVKADRELPVVWAVAKGSLRNKLILVPAALLISAVVPWLVTPLLMLGGAFLCFEGAEKLLHVLSHDKQKDAAAHAEHVKALADPATDVVAFEQKKIKGAVRTDFILSAEIIAITLGSVAGAPFVQQVIVVSGMAVAITLVVYGLVGGIVKIDDLGLYLSQRAGRLAQGAGRGLLAAAPVLMKTLSIVGTAAMFMVGGGILAHGLPMLHHGVEALAENASELPNAGVVLGPLSATALNAGIGLVAGALLVGAGKAIAALRGKRGD